MSYQVWFAYMLACWVISISRGAGAIASMSSGLNYGFRHGYWNALGLQLALLVQIAIVAAGAGVLFATTPWALPQFLDLSKPQWIQYMIMAATMVTIDLIVMAGYTGLAAKVLSLLKSPKQQKVMNRTFASLFAGAAFLLSLVHQ